MLRPGTPSATVEPARELSKGRLAHPGLDKAAILLGEVPFPVQLSVGGPQHAGVAVWSPDAVAGTAGQQRLPPTW